MATRKPKGPKKHKFSNKLLLNQWLISLFVINNQDDKVVRPFHKLADPIRDPRMEGLDADNIHKFYHNLVNSELFWDESGRVLSKAELLSYEENIVRHTQSINAKRSRPIVWKYYQWLTLLFVEIYLARFFESPEKLLLELNTFVERFNLHWRDYADMPLFAEEDLNKLCLQNATGSGKTLLMHVNLLQYQHYAKKHGREKDLSRVILLTPNKRLSEQHIDELRESNIQASNFAQVGFNLFTMALGLNRVDVLEITKLADKEGPNSIATRSLGEQNLLLVDEGHRGLSGRNVNKNKNAWYKNRLMLCEKGFTFEYSATFEQSVRGTGHEDDYAKSVLFDYSYRWFYEDGFGKDYQILNLPESFKTARVSYMTACLLKFYQQLRIYEENDGGFVPFNLEKPLWVFVGSTVSSGKLNKAEKLVATDVALIIQFIAGFLENRQTAVRRIEEILTGKGQDTGLLDKDGNDIFAGSFTYLARKMNKGETIDELYRDILSRLFKNRAGGKLILERIKGDSGEIALKAGNAQECFGLINVGNTKGLCDHLGELNMANLIIEDSDFTSAIFASVNDSSSPVNLLIGSKKFVEGWDCWRVSTMGLMHVGSTEGAQIIQLFGRGIRLKGYKWCLKRSGHAHAPVHPAFIEELETLNVFGIKADFMEKFRNFLKEEGLPGNERRRIITIPLNVTYDFGKKLKILRPKRKRKNGREYNFKKDAPIQTVGYIPDYVTSKPVVVDWYPRILALQSKSSGSTNQKDKSSFSELHLSLLDYDALFFELEQFKRERSWYNFNISKQGIRLLLTDSNWYLLYLPKTRMNPVNFDGVLLLQQVATELLKRYCDHYYNYCKRKYIEPRLELRELTSEDDNIPKEDFYQLIVDGDEAQVITGIQNIKKDLEEGKSDLLQVDDLQACNFGKHLFQPLFHVRSGGKITVLPVALNESEYQFVTDLKTWCDGRKNIPEKDQVELFLLRNLSRGKGVGFFEAGNFHPDFIFWMLAHGKQYVTFIEPHGLLHEGPGSEKVLFHKRIKDVEKRMNDSDVILNSFILSWTKFPQLKWDRSLEEFEANNVLFMTDDRDHYIDKLFSRLTDVAV
jgi:superfamily II DNA or RNA helicase